MKQIFRWTEMAARVIVALLMSGCWLGLAAAGPMGQFPLKVSRDGHHFVDHHGRPFFYRADSAWDLLSQDNPTQIRRYLRVRHAQGFNAVQVKLLPPRPGLRNQSGVAPFLTATDLGTPNEAYFAAVESIVRQARQQGMVIALAPAWLSCCDAGWSTVVQQNGPLKCREYGRYLGHRFQHDPNVIWILGGDRAPGMLTGMERQLALGLKESAPFQLITSYPGVRDSSPDAFPQQEGWLDFSLVALGPDGNANRPGSVGRISSPPTACVAHRGTVGPLIIEDTKADLPEDIRRQAYATILCGRAGWAFAVVGSHLDTVPDTVLASQPAALGLSAFDRFFAGLPWTRLRADRTHHLVPETETGKHFNSVISAMTADGSLAVIYLPQGRTQLTVNLSVMSTPVEAQWFDPSDGHVRPAADGDLPNQNQHTFSRPLLDHQGGHDYLLVLRAGSGSKVRSASRH